MAKPTVLPEWDETEVNSVEPDATHKAEGWLAPAGVPEKPPYQSFNFWQNSVWKWLNEINIKGILGYDALTDYIADLSYTIGSDGNLYQCLINNGPSSSVVNPVGDATGTWENIIQEAIEIKDVAASVAANALTVELKADSLDFRKTDLADGEPENIAFSDLSLVAPSGATLGTLDGIESRIIIIAINNSGTIELAVVNIAGGNDLSETGLITTTAIDSTADTKNVFYSTSARTGVPYRVVGLIKSTQTTAGTWAQTLAVQGAGGQALTSMSSMGYGQTWQAVTRTASVTYYNSTGKPIITAGLTGGGATMTMTIDGTAMYAVLSPSATGIPSTYIIPPGSSYSFTGVWGSNKELR